MENLLGVLGFLLLASGLPLQEAKRESGPLWTFAFAGPRGAPRALERSLGIRRKRGIFRMLGLRSLLGVHGEQKPRGHPKPFPPWLCCNWKREDSLYPKNKASLPNHPQLLQAHRVELLDEVLVNLAELPTPCPAHLRARRLQRGF